MSGPRPSTMPPMTSWRVTCRQSVGWIALGWLALVPTGVWAKPMPIPLRVGFAKVKLSLPTDCQMTGFEDRGAIDADGVADPLYARATMLEQGGTRVAVVSLDVFAVDASLRERVLRRAETLKLTDAVLSATGTVRGPAGLLKARRWRPSLGAYRDDVAHAVLSATHRAITDAQERLAAATVSFSQIETPSDHVAVFRAPNGSVRGVWLGPCLPPPVGRQRETTFSAGLAGHLCDTLEAARAGVSFQVLPGPAHTQEGRDARVRAGPMIARLTGAIARAVSTSAAATPAMHVSTRAAKLHTPWRSLLDRQGAAVLAHDEPWHLPVTTLTMGTQLLQTVPGELAQCDVKSPDRWTVTHAQGYGGTFIGAYRFKHRAVAASRNVTGPEAVPEVLRRPSARARRDSFVPAMANDHPEVTHLTPSVPKSPAAKASDAYRLGHAHGSLLRDALRAFLEDSEAALLHAANTNNERLVGAWVKRYGGAKARAYVLLELIKQARALLPHIPDDQLDEMEGIGDAAGVPFDSILLINTFLTLAEQTSNERILSLPARCTNVVVHGRATSMGQLLHASTLDWALRDLLAPATRPFVIEPAKGHAFLSISWPGMVGTLRAMNTHGLAITEESCAAPKDTCADGLALPLLLRTVVQYERTLTGAVQRLTEAPGTCGYNVSVSDGNQLDARTVELTASHHQVRVPVSDVLVGVALDAPDSSYAGPRDPAIPAADGSSATRYRALASALDHMKHPLRLRDVQAVITDPTIGIRNEGTLLACVFEPSARRAHVALDLRGDRAPTWKRVDLRAILENDLPATRRGLPPVPRAPTMIKRRDRAFTLVPGATRWSLVFPSPLPSGHAFNDSVKAELWLPQKAKGVVIHLPAWKEPTLAAHRLLATQLALAGIATVILPLPYQASRAAPQESSGAWTLSANLARTRAALVQGLADTLALSRLLEDEYGFEPARQGVTGVSLGAHVAAVAYGAYPERFHHGGFILAGGNVHEAFMKKNSVTTRIHAKLVRRGVTLEEAGELMLGMDPLHHADPDRREGIVLIAADADDVVAPANVKLLAKAYGGAPITWLSGGHYAPANPLMAVRAISALRTHLLGRLALRPTAKTKPK